ncbi:PA4780 family RIO1-like protein kinase [Nitrosomonas sp. Is37]|uniref:PA4780 family RIO1-like protein kinase n=1 Tax=Nitrosomonas sp. Is37 TaxID=3080535 RepID=UPI00294B9897|nr:PA4780 family RIO1-like protein kinase [Nitrosomonas sp. Is37]MDV6343274.1 PA4780 family RIO1-like protein kinase [Nitrosomonas sp. Is37]
MKIPKRIEPLVEEGLVDSVICQLMSGKESMVYVVRCGSDIRCAKVYKEANKRNFRQSVSYTEGGLVRNGRRMHAIQRRSYFGWMTQKGAWQSTEVDTMSHLATVGVPTPKYHNFFEGVLLMELITDSNGDVAPRLNDLTLSAELARMYHDFLIRQIVRMLCHGVVHGDLSEYNVLIGNQGPVIIDFPQAIFAASNHNAQRILKRDVDNVTTYLSRFAPELAHTDYGSEIWSLYQRGKLHLEVNLTGNTEEKTKPVNVSSVLNAINAALKKEIAWQRYKQERWTSRQLQY